MPVALVGAGPGHPELLTLRAVLRLAEADVIFHDRLVPQRILDRTRPEARRVCVDAVHGCRPERYADIAAQMIEAARQGLRVVRLKGGDPFLFGRGGEEAEALRRAGIDFEVVPGVTAALGAAAFAGVPLTHRRHASAVAFVTGHQRPEGDLDWPALAHFPGTLVLYMGMSRLANIVAGLLEHGKSPSTPAAVVRWATTPAQRSLTTTLGELPSAVERSGLGPPSLVVLGDVVTLRKGPSWFESLPLFGKSVLVTRPRHQAGELTAPLEELGAEVLAWPALEIEPPPVWAPVDRALAELACFQWLVFTSANGVEAFLGRLLRTGRDLRALGGLRIAAIGPATADVLRRFHLRPDFVPAVYTSEGLAAGLTDLVFGQRVLLARADRGRELLQQELSKVATVEQVAVYSQRDAGPPDEALLGRLRKGQVDFVTLTSSNVVRSLVRQLDEQAIGAIREGKVRLVSISPVTSAAVRELGLSVAAEAVEATTEGVVEAILTLA